ncbi:pilus assembly protein TadB [Nakamurella antarctica]|uniref:Pilus assembly protein TadB n=1 Tax=Nakamurella antarctica TaxID=1902245 RepID=A0A3G8ZXM1_9ACTN|nr:type II secretion system F family protein [Nakamurella antarctica]AZI58391.1 pilus assembly protein TadB [Nakamurella antarctica]
MTGTWVGMLLGGAVGVGVLLLIFFAPPMRKMSLGDRIAPYLADAPVPSKLLSATTSGSSLSQLSAPLVKKFVGRLDTLLGGRKSVENRLQATGSPMTIEQFRADQVLWGALGFLAGIAAGLLAVFIAAANPLAVMLLAVGFGATGVLMRDYWLTREVQQIDAEILAEFPVIAEMLALAVTAGEGPAGAIERITKLARGALVSQLAAILADTRSGTPLLEALTSARDRARLEPFSRFLDGMAVAIERGTPLADVLRAQAADVRALGKRELMEAGGRKEIAMMVPAVNYP